MFDLRLLRSACCRQKKTPGPLFWLSLLFISFSRERADGAFTTSGKTSDLCGHMSFTFFLSVCTTQISSLYWTPVWRWSDWSPSSKHVSDSGHWCNTTSSSAALLIPPVFNLIKSDDVFTACSHLTRTSLTITHIALSVGVVSSSAAPLGRPLENVFQSWGRDAGLDGSLFVSSSLQQGL